MTTTLVIVFIAAALLGTSVWLIVSYLRQSRPTMAQRQRAVDRALNQMERDLWR